MTLTRMIAGIALLAGTSLATPAFAQTTTTDGAPAFRVPLKDGPSDPGVPSAWTWVERISACSTSCGTGTRTTTYECQNAADYDWTTGGYGVAEPSSSCEAAIGSAPASSSESCTIYSSCSYDWVAPTPVKTATPPGRVGCGQVRTQFDPYCRRSDGSVLPKSDHAFCQADRPDYDPVAAGNPDALGYDRTAVDTSSCNTSDHAWKADTWSSWSNSCSVNATHTRSVTCVRRFDSATVADAQCDAATKPVASETQPVYDSCSYSWDSGAWSAYSSTCSASATRTRAVTCKRSNGDVLDDSFCSAVGTKPDTTETSAQYDSCGYSAANWGNATFSSTCSANATKTETAQCQRSDGTIVADGECTSRGTALSRTSTEANYTTCGYAWQSGNWSGTSSQCSAAATQTRSVTCQRGDGAAVADAQCTGVRPNSSQTVADYSSCGYSQGAVVSYGPWSSQCSASATRTAQHSCQRSDGSTVADSECTSRGVSLTSSSGPTPVYDACGYTWQNGAWSASSSTCSISATQTRSVWCQRSDGTTVGDPSCTAARPPASQQIADYSGCGYSQGPITSYGAWSSTCSASATRTEQHSCTRSDGTTVPDSECTTRSISLVTNSSPTAVYDGCGYAWNQSTWSATSSQCSASAQQTRSVWCQRADGATVADASCSGAGAKPGASQTVADYSACSYAWNYSAWTAYDSSCSASATRTRTVWCQRSDATTVGDASCGGGKPSPTESTAVYTGCSYTPSYGTMSACVSNTQSAPMVSCQRSDGASVATSFCTNAGSPANQTQSCTSSQPAAFGYFFGPITGQSNWNWYQMEGPAHSLSAGNQKPNYACASYGYTVRTFDDYLPPSDPSVRALIVPGTCYEYLDGTTASPPQVWDGASTDRIYIYTKP